MFLSFHAFHSVAWSFNTIRLSIHTHIYLIVRLHYIFVSLWKWLFCLLQIVVLSLVNDRNYFQVQIEANIPHHDILRTQKLELLHQHCPPKIGDVNSFSFTGNWFTIKLVLVHDSLYLENGLYSRSRTLLIYSELKIE